jgi:polynucleotide 5'-kinase involved in rRNA processing
MMADVVPLFLFSIAIYTTLIRAKRVKNIIEANTKVMERHESARALASASSFHISNIEPFLTIDPNDILARTYSLDEDTAEPLNRKIHDKATHGNVIVLGIAGGSGSGKTTLAQAIIEALGDVCKMFSNDLIDSSIYFLVRRGEYKLFKP